MHIFTARLFLNYFITSDEILIFFLSRSKGDISKLVLLRLCSACALYVSVKPWEDETWVELIKHALITILSRLTFSTGTGSILTLELEDVPSPSYVLTWRNFVSLFIIVPLERLRTDNCTLNYKQKPMAISPAEYADANSAL